MKLSIAIFCLLTLGVCCALPSKDKPKSRHPPHFHHLPYPRPSNQTNQRIVDGEEIVWNRAPWMVSIQSQSHLCAGVILQTRYVLTAANCVASLPASHLRIRYNSDRYHSGGQVTRVDEIFVNPTFDPETLEGDLAILKTEATLPSIPDIAGPVLTSRMYPGMPLWVQGWGFRQENGGCLSAKFRNATLHYRVRQCEGDYVANGITLPVNSFCYNGDEEGNSAQGICQGDVGAPLIQYVAAPYNNYMIFGIASFSWGCSRPGFDSVFTHSGPYYNWIISVAFQPEE